jgi:hypothetical protein
VTREVLVHGGELAGEAHLLAHPPRLLRDVEAEDARGAAAGAEQGGEDADRRGLAGAVGAEQAVHGAALDAEVDAVDGARVAEVFEEGGGLDRWRHGLVVRGSSSIARDTDVR